MSANYTPLPQHLEGHIPSKGDVSRHPPARPRSWIAPIALLLSLPAIAYLSLGFPQVQNSHHITSAVRSGYLGALIEDEFQIHPPYTLNPPLMHPHPAIDYANRHHHKNKKHPHHLPPKVAEGVFLEVPTEASCMEASRRYTEKEHRAGSGNDHLTALRVKSELEAFFGLPTTGPYESVFEAGSHDSQRMIRTAATGPRVWVDTYYPVMNEPVSREVSILLPNSTAVQWSASLREDIVEEDPFSKLRDEVPVFHGLSASGNVTSQIVYAGYGRKTDFEALEKAGIEVQGRIALVKYGGVFRGLKVKAAEEAGAVGCIIYSDPRDDGPMTEANGHKPYPDGPARNPSAVQRGSVQYLSSYPGDPTTPGLPAYANATRSTDGGNIPHIPSLPMSYRDATALLDLLKGKGKKASTFGEEWNGDIKNVEYWTGPSEQVVRFVNEVDTKVMPIWNTMAIIPGMVSDEAVMIGNHRDAWVLGASDPSSGTAVTHEIYKGLGELLKKGWKPLRTIIIASWDAEEYGLIGSTEWAEDFADWIPSNVVSYLNLDSTGAGTQFGSAASPSLALLMKSTSEEVRHPSDPTRSAFSARFGDDDQIADDDFEALFSSSTGVPSLGSGSDFTPFLQHLGVASVDGPGFSPSSSDPVYHYHSIYDNQYWMEKYGDPGFTRHIVAARILGLVLLRLSDSIVLPLNVTQYATELSDYRDKVAHIHQALNFTDPLDLEQLSTSISTLQNATGALDADKENALRKLHELIRPPHLKSCRDHHGPSHKKLKAMKKILEEIRTINKKLAGFEAGFISEDGLKDREWYRHIGTAPGKWLGYGATTFPSITEALSLDHNVTLAQHEAGKVSALLEAMTKRLSA